MNYGKRQNPFYFEYRESNLVRHHDPAIEETIKQIKVLKSHKALLKDQITGELLKIIDGGLVKYIHRVVDLIWHKEVLAKKWRTALACPIYKKGDR